MVNGVGSLIRKADPPPKILLEPDFLVVRGKLVRVYPGGVELASSEGVVKDVTKVSVRAIRSGLYVSTRSCK